MLSVLRNAPKAMPKILATPAFSAESSGQTYLRRTMSSCKNCTKMCAAGMKRSITTNTNDNAIQEMRDVFHKEFQGPLYAFPNSYQTITNTSINSGNIEIIFSGGETNTYPLVWLRDNCQCNQCFDPKALGRSFLMSELSMDVNVSSSSVSDNNTLEIVWQDGHKSSYSSQWLQERSFSDVARKRYRNMHLLPKKLWTKGYEVSKFDYNSVMEDEKELLKWLVKQESHGATLLNNTPADPAAAFNLAERIAKVKYTHFGDYSNVVNHPETNNLAYTNKKLNLHNDMPQYSEIPGLIFLHMIKQHTGKGGDTVISDGFNAAEQMRQKYPDEFKLLCNTDVYFWDKGDAKDDLEMTQFYKINKGPTISCDNQGNIHTIRFNNQVRDSHLDLSPEDVTKFYAALKIYFDLMYENSVSYKMKDGEMTILDNVRCQHAREAFDGDITSRHLATTFMAWDEALCRRRRLQEKFQLFRND